MTLVSGRRGLVWMAAVLVCAMLPVMGGMPARGASKVKLRIAFPTERGGLGDRQVQVFVKTVERDVPDVFQIETYPGSQLGTGTENVQALETGTLECAALGSEGLAVDPQLGFWDLPCVLPQYMRDTFPLSEDASGTGRRTRSG